MEKRAGIYIHIPFCERKCTYCNFNTTDFDGSLARRYIEAVGREIAWWGARLAAHQASERVAIDTIFFGGGTPSIVEAGELQSLVERCRDSFDLAPDAEITIEINPATFSRNKLEQWLDAGINRASVGVQSFIDRELESLSRTHTARDARRTLDDLREAGFENISLDLIAGLPEQTLADWQLNLAEALRASPEHMSLYLLEVKEGTQLFAQIKRGLRRAVDDDLAADMYRLTRDCLLGSGYEQYEISNFALIAKGARDRPGPFRSQHNMKYWTGAPFYGMGCGAHSYDARARWVNILRTDSYIDAVVSKGCAIAERHKLSERDLAAEALFMGLRLTEGVDLDAFRAAYGLDVLESYGEDIKRLDDAGLVEVSAGRLKLTEKGLLLSNEVFVSFV